MPMVHGESDDPAASGSLSAMQPTAGSLEGIPERGTFIVTTISQQKFPNSTIMQRTYNYSNINTYYYRYYYLSSQLPLIFLFIL